MIVDHDDVELEIGFLAQRTFHGIRDGLLSVENWNDHRSLVEEFLFAEIRLAIKTGIDEGSHLVEVLCASLLHLYLHLSVARVHIVELFLAALSVVEFIFCIEEFIEMENLAHTAQIETQIVETRILIVRSVLLGDEVAEGLSLDEPETSEVEVVAKATRLVINNWMLDQLAGFFLFLSNFCSLFIFFDQGIIVGVNHDGSRIICRAEESLQGIESPSDRSGLGADHHIVGIGVFCNAFYRVAAFQSVNDYEGASIRHLVMGCKISAHQEIDMLNRLVVMKFLKCALGYFNIFTR